MIRGARKGEGGGVPFSRATTRHRHFFRAQDAPPAAWAILSSCVGPHMKWGGFHAWLLDTQLYPRAMYVSTLTGQALAGFMTDASRARSAKECSVFLRGAAWQRKDLSSWVEGGEEEEESSDEVGDISPT